MDKVVLHAVTDNIMYDALTRSFIRDNHASQKERAPMMGCSGLRGHMIDYYRKHGSAEGWVLKEMCGTFSRPSTTTSSRINFGG